MKVSFSYLERQFGANPLPNSQWHYTERIFKALRAFITTGDFTLGAKLDEFENTFARFTGTTYAIGVNSGTDALFLSLKALGVGKGDEVITSAETFIATAGAIQAAGARPVFVDVNDAFVIDEEKIEASITKKTKVIIPVWFTGNAPDMSRIEKIARAHHLAIVEDSCCAIDASYQKKKAGSWGVAGTFSFHPLKNLNVWSDGGMITTNSSTLARKLRLLRNHGLVSRDKVKFFGFNSRLDTLEAVIALEMINDVPALTNKRIANAKRLDEAFRAIPEIDIPPRDKRVRHVFHLYMIRVKKRDALLRFCLKRGIEAKIHYPILLPYQECAKSLGYKKGDFPKAERDISSIITLPCHPYLKDEELEYMIDTVSQFYHHKGKRP